MSWPTPGAPELIVADEPISALDVSVRAQILNLLTDLRERLGLGMVFISHDVQTVRYLADRIAVLYLGWVVQEGPADRVTATPRHPYTEALLSATPSLLERPERIVLHGPVPSATHPPTGCPFRTRCWKADDACATEFPVTQTGSDGRLWHCVHPQGEPHVGAQPQPVPAPVPRPRWRGLDRTPSTGRTECVLRAEGSTRAFRRGSPAQQECRHHFVRRGERTAGLAGLGVMMLSRGGKGHRRRGRRVNTPAVRTVGRWHASYKAGSEVPSC